MIKTCNIDNCNIYQAQKYIKHKWIPIIIYCINLDINNFNGLLNQIEHISNASLSRGLNILVKDEILELKDKNYLLTKKGMMLNNIINLMAEFAN